MPVSIEGLTGWRRLHLQSVGSTNVEAFNFAEQGDVGRLWITAGEQLTGKARRGRSWVSKPGNLYSSLLLIDPSEPDALATLPLAVSLALHKALVALDGSLEKRLAIKWPNDLLLDGKKLSGILLEARKDSFGRLAVVIGMGTNVKHFPDNPLYPATSLSASGREHEPEALFPHLADAMAKTLRIWSQGAGFSIIRREWLDRAVGIGKPIVARMPDVELSGVFEDIDEEGFLLLKDDEGHVRQISAADIFFGNSNEIGA